MEPADLRSMPLPELEAFVLALGEKRFRAVQLFRWMHQKCARSFEEMSDLPRALRNPDGVHLSYFGGTILVDKLIAKLNEDIQLAMPEAPKTNE